MTQDEIIRIAREAKIIHAQDTDGQWDGITDQQLLGYPYANPRSQEWAEKRIVEILEPFAALVAAHEREACAKVCEEDMGWLDNGGGELCAKAIRWKGEK